MTTTIQAVATQQQRSRQRNPRPAARSGTFAIGGDLPVHRLGFGAMQLTGPGVWGEPADHAEAIAVLRRAVELGINFIDTADSYGPYVSEELIREALHPYTKGLVIATKAGLARTGPADWIPLGRPRVSPPGMRDEPAPIGRRAD
jgi:pyridoxine 4-dehydrogenase